MATALRKLRYLEHTLGHAALSDALASCAPDDWHSLPDGEMDETPSARALVAVATMLARWLDQAETVADIGTISRIACDLGDALGCDPARKPMVQAIERWIGRLQSPDVSGKPVMDHLCALMRLTRHDNSKQAVGAIKRLSAQDEEEAAARLLETVLQLAPTRPGFATLIDVLSDNVRRETIREDHFARLAVLATSDHSALAIYARQLIHSYRFEEALEALGPYQSHDPAALSVVRAEALFWTDRFDEAEATCKKALDVPGVDEKLQISLLTILNQCRILKGDGEAAVRTLRKRQQLLPSGAPKDSQWFKSHVLEGDTKRAFGSYWESPTSVVMDQHFPPTVNLNDLEAAKKGGHPINGHCVAVSFMAVGDEVRMARLFPDVARLFERLTCVVDHRLVETFADNFPQIEFVGVDKTRTDPAVPAGLAPHLDGGSYALAQAADHVLDFKPFGAVFPDLIGQGCQTRAHLKTDPSLRQRWRDWLRAQKAETAVGLFWRTGVSSVARSHKHVELQQMLSAIGSWRGPIIPLQFGLTEDELSLIARDERMVSLPDGFDAKNDIRSALALFAELEIAVSLPGSTQHMLGAVGTDVLCPCHPYERRWRAAPGTNHDLFAPSVRLISGAAEAGLSGSLKRLDDALPYLSRNDEGSPRD